VFSTYFWVWVFAPKRKIPIMLLMSGVVDDLLGCFCDDVNNISYNVDDFVVMLMILTFIFLPFQRLFQKFIDDSIG